MKPPPFPNNTLKTAFLAVNLAVVALTLSSADEEVFKSFPFVAELDLPAKLETITGSIVAADALEHSNQAIVVFVGKYEKKNHDFRYSFNFDGRPVLKYAAITANHQTDLFGALKNPANYGDGSQEFDLPSTTDKSDALAKAYDEAWAQDLALEVAARDSFVRIYLDRDFTRCYYVSSSGVRSKDWKIAQELTSILRVIARESKEELIEISKGGATANPAATVQPETKSAVRIPNRVSPSIKDVPR